MTERGRHDLHATPTTLAIGPSALQWDGTTLAIALDERTAPLPSRLRGTVHVTPSALLDRSRALDHDGAHRWQVLAPHARVEVALDRPGVHWSGTAYVDTNRGSAPLEQAFSGWHWSRARLRGGTAIFYDVAARDGRHRCLALHCKDDGRVSDFPPPAVAALPRSGWDVARTTRADAGGASVVRTLVDAPFYARSLVASCTLRERVTAVHESLSLDRFNAPWVRALLPFRMPRHALHHHG